MSVREVRIQRNRRLCNLQVRRRQILDNLLPPVKRDHINQNFPRADPECWYLRFFLLSLNRPKQRTPRHLRNLAKALLPNPRAPNNRQQ
jgi:hypothetical protein